MKKQDLGGFERVSVLYIAALGWISNYVLPYDLGQSMIRLKLTEEQAGWLATAVLLVLAAAAAVVGRHIPTVDKRFTSIVASAVALLSTIALIMSDSLVLVVALKLVFAAAIGVLVACAFSLASYYRQPERLFAQVGATMAILYGAVMVAMPMAIARWGVHGPEVVQLILVAVGLLLASGMPVARMARGGMAAQARLSSAVLFLLGGIFLMFVAQSVTVSFATPAGQALGVSEDAVGLAFMAGCLMQLPAAVLIALLGEKAGHYRPIAVAMAGLAFVVLGVYCGGAPWMLLLALAINNALATIVNAYALGILTRLDESGTSSAMAGSITNFGYAFGPALAGGLIGAGGFSYAGWGGAVLVGVALVLMLSSRASGRLAPNQASEAT